MQVHELPAWLYVYVHLLFGVGQFWGEQAFVVEIHPQLQRQHQKEIDCSNGRQFKYIENMHGQVVPPHEGQYYDYDGIKEQPARSFEASSSLGKGWF